MYDPYIKLFCLTNGEIEVNYKDIQVIKTHHNETFVTLSSGKTYYLELDIDTLKCIIAVKYEEEKIHNISMMNEYLIVSN